MTHPITPPPELVQQWASEWMRQQDCNRDNFMTERAAQWGADQELEACCDVLKDWGSCLSPDLRAARRPKPLSLKEQALDELSIVQIHLNKFGTGVCTETIRRALEALPE